MSKEVLLGTVVPVLGGLVAIVMYASPIKACYMARQQQQLGVRGRRESLHQQQAASVLPGS